VAEAADKLLETSIADLSIYAERRRDLLTAIARLGMAGPTCGNARLTGKRSLAQ
jgi:hypothetical protein